MIVCSYIPYMFFVSYIYRSARLSDIHIIKMKCNTCNNAYVGQSGRSLNVRHKDYIRRIRTNNPLSTHALHILQSGHEYGTITDTLQLLKTCKKGIRMNCWEALYTQVFHQHKMLVTEQQINEPNPLYELVNTTQILPRNP